MIIIHEVIIDYQIICTQVSFFVIKHTSVMQPKTSFINYTTKHIVVNYATKYIVIKYQIRHHQVSCTSSSSNQIHHRQVIKYIVTDHQSNTSSLIINQISMQCDRLDTMHVVPNVVIIMPNRAYWAEAPSSFWAEAPSSLWAEAPSSLPNKAIVIVIVMRMNAMRLIQSKQFMQLPKQRYAKQCQTRPFNIVVVVIH